LGATVSQLTQLLSLEFLKLVSLHPASPFRLPGGLFTMAAEFRLQNRNQVVVFAVAGAAALLVALFTVSFQAGVKAWSRNPVKKSEVGMNSLWKTS
jgi:hypothetical protein